jgi:hypothetical protein
MPAEVTSFSPAATEFDCWQCGEFRMTTEALQFLEPNSLTHPQVGTVSGWIRRNPGALITSKDIPKFRRLRAPSAEEKVGNVLLELAAAYPRLGTTITHPVPSIRITIAWCNEHLYAPTHPAGGPVKREDAALKWLAIASASSADEVDWIISALERRGYLSRSQRPPTNARGREGLVITDEGWCEVERRKSINPASKIGFVAMSFRREFDDLYKEGIAPGIALAGYEAFRIDGKEHNNRIDDEIIASIKISRFLVADLTVNRGGIYFEAGFALGLGLPVIWLVNTERLDCVHFDTRQYYFIRWRRGEWVELQRALQLRIRATIGAGPISPSELVPIG